MLPRHTLERRRRFVSSVGSSSDDHDKSMCPSGASNLDRYNSEDGWLRLNVF